MSEKDQSIKDKSKVSSSSKKSTEANTNLNTQSTLQNETPSTSNPPTRRLSIKKSSLPKRSESIPKLKKTESVATLQFTELKIDPSKKSETNRRLSLKRFSRDKTDCNTCTAFMVKTQKSKTAISDDTRKLPPDNKQTIALKIQDPKVGVYTATPAIMQNFTLRLHRLISATQTNTFLSPYSVAFALSIALTGSRGPTAEQIGKCLEAYNLNELLDEFDKMGTALGCTDEHYVGIGNKLFAASNVKVNDNYRQFIAREFFTQISHLDLSGDPDTSAREINGWLQRTSFGKLNNVISQHDLQTRANGETIKALFISALYFKCTWSRITHHFAVFRNRPFFYGDEPTDYVMVEMMYSRCLCNFATIDYLNCKVVEIPVQNEAFSFVMLLPHKHSNVSDLEDELIYKDIRTLPSILHRNRVDLFIPKFSIDNSISLRTPLSLLGITDLFMPGVAKLTNMFEESQENLSIWDVRHKAHIDVTPHYDLETHPKEGQLDAFGPWRRIPLHTVLTFEFNRPFMFMLVEQQQRTIFAMGVLKKPASSQIQAPGSSTQRKHSVVMPKK